MTDTLRELYEVIQARRTAAPGQSYTARLFAAGEAEMAKKVGEEAIEVVLAAAGQGNQRLVEEAADLVYHLLALLAAHDLTLDDLERELWRRRQ